MNANSFRRAAMAGLALGALGLLAGCAGFPGWGGWSQTPSNQDMAMVLEHSEPVTPPPAPAQLAPPRRPMTTEVSFGDGK
jgi:hypothetical protein